MAHERIELNIKPWLMIVLALTLGFAVGCGSGNDGGQVDTATQTKPEALPIEPITLKGKVFELELALNDETRELGLSDRKSIADDGGMLFVFTEPRTAQFVMRRCYVPIDLIYVDRKGYVDSLHEMEVIEPIGSPAWHNPYKNYASAGAVQYAIELKGGMIDTLGLKRGDKIALPHDRLQALAD